MEFTFSHWVVTFALFSCLGWLIETLWCWAGTKKLVNRGFLIGPWCPIYGFGAVVIILLNEPLKSYPALVFVAAVCSTSLLEYFTGWLMETLFKTRWWDYSHRKFNLKGRICLRNSLLFGVLGLALIYVLHPAVTLVLSQISESVKIILSAVILLLLSADTLHSLSTVSELQKRLESTKEYLTELAKQAQQAAAKKKPTAPLLQKPVVGLRLVKAFPKIETTFQSEIEKLREDWITYYNNKRTLAEKKRDKLKKRMQTEWQQARLSYKGITVTRMIWVFLIASVVGYIVETLYCFVTLGTIQSRQGMLYGPFSQVYGFGAVIMVLVLAPFFAKGDRWLFFGGALIGGLFEAVCSVIQESLFGSVSWEYSQHNFSFFGGRTSLIYMFFWGILAVFYMKHIYPSLSSVIDRIPKSSKRVLTICVAVLLTADMLVSGAAVSRWSQRISNIPAENAVEAWLDTAFPNETLKEIYPNMIFPNS